MKLPPNLSGFVVETELRKSSKNTRLFWQITLKTTYGNIRCFMWGAQKDAETDPRFPHYGEAIELVKFVDEVEEKGSIVLDSFKRLDKDNLPDELKNLLSSNNAPGQSLENAFALLKDKSYWKDDSYRSLVMNCFSQVDDKILELCPAATHVHHSYRGGLMVHTAEVVSICRGIVDSSKEYSFINSDVVLASAWLHDLGKVDTYFIDDFGQAVRKTEEKTIGHMFYSMHRVANANFANEKILKEVLHCIASHHGAEHSIKEPQSIEAYILSSADFISSRNGLLANVLLTEPPTEETFRAYGDNYYLTASLKNAMGK